MDSAPDLGSGGREFESHHFDHSASSLIHQGLVAEEREELQLPSEDVESSELRLVDSIE